MRAIGSLALYFTAEDTCSVEKPETRAALLGALLEAACSGASAVLSDPDTPLRAGPRLAARKGYLGILACAVEEEAYDLLLYAAARGLTAPFFSPWGIHRMVRVESEQGNSPFVRHLSFTHTAPAPLSGPVRLKAYSPLVAPVDILADLDRAQRELAKRLQQPSLSPEGELPHWNFLEISMNTLSSNANHRKGHITLTSSHPFGGLILQYALLKGFGSDKRNGFGHLDLCLDSSKRRPLP